MTSETIKPPRYRVKSVYYPMDQSTEYFIYDTDRKSYVPNLKTSSQLIHSADRREVATLVDRLNRGETIQ